MEAMQRQMQGFVSSLNQELAERAAAVSGPIRATDIVVKPRLARTSKRSKQGSVAECGPTKMEAMLRQMQEFVSSLNQELADRAAAVVAGRRARQFADSGVVVDSKRSK